MIGNVFKYLFRHGVLGHYESSDVVLFSFPGMLWLRASFSSTRAECPIVSSQGRSQCPGTRILMKVPHL